MPYPIREASKLLALLLSGVGIFLSSWIVIPAPIFSLLPLGVGAPELSPWLVVLNAIAFGITQGAIAFRVSFLGGRDIWLQRLTFGVTLLGRSLSLLPFAQ